MDRLLKRSISLCGIKHCGKSTLGKKLSQILSVEFADSDDLLLSEYNERHSSPFSSFRDLYREKGKDVFMEYEYIGLSNFIANIETPGVIALGGGIADNRKALDLVRENTFLVFLVVPFETLFQRVMNHGRPPFLDANDPEKQFFDIYTQRDAVYRSSAEISIEIGTESIEDALKIVYDSLMEEHDVWQ